jgi:hypothetical protein
MDLGDIKKSKSRPGRLRESGRMKRPRGRCGSMRNLPAGLLCHTVHIPNIQLAVQLFFLFHADRAPVRLQLLQPLPRPIKNALHQ